MRTLLHGLAIADPPEAWRSAGFSVVDDRLLVGDVVLHLDGEGGGIRGWAVTGVAAGQVVDGLSVVDVPQAAAGVPHPNGTSELDHLVVTSPDRRRTLAALAAVGLEPRRTRDVTLGGTPSQQTFFRMGAPILELVTPVEPSGDGPAVLWGLAFTVDDLDATAALLGPALGRVKEAVQPGRRIASLRHRDVGVSVPVAFLDHGGRPPSRA
jgi:hypothetical protein